MKVNLCCILLLLLAKPLFCQEKYQSKSGELIFSFADIAINNNNINTPLRFSLFLHASNFYHIDFNNNIGIYTGTGIRNVGFTTKQANITIKRRNYYIGLPLALKIGNLKQRKYLYAGVEGEIGINYKEKRFDGDNKIDVFDEWFSKRTPLFMPSALIGVNTKRGINLKFKYYLKDFLDKNYQEGGVKIYQLVNHSKMFYISLSANIPELSKKRKSKRKKLPISI